MDFVVVGAWFEDFHEVAEAGDDGFADEGGLVIFIGKFFGEGMELILLKIIRTRIKSKINSKIRITFPSSVDSVEHDDFQV